MPLRLLVHGVVATVAWLLSASSASVFTPEVANIEPLGGTRGAEVEVLLRGARLATPQELIVYEPGLTVVALETFAAVSEASNVETVYCVQAPVPIGEAPLSKSFVAVPVWIVTSNVPLVSTPEAAVNVVVSMFKSRK